MFQNKFYQVGYIGDRSSNVWLGSSENSKFWPLIITALSRKYVGSRHDMIETRRILFLEETRPISKYVKARAKESQQVHICRLPE